MGGRKSGLRLSLFGQNEQPPLHVAVKANDAEAVTVLIWARADPQTQRDSDGRSPMELAEELGHRQDVLQALRTGCDPLAPFEPDPDFPMPRAFESPSFR